MKISSEQRSHVTPGKVVNILSTGVARCDRIFMPLCQLCSAFGENFILISLEKFNFCGSPRCLSTSRLLNVHTKISQIKMDS